MYRPNLQSVALAVPEIIVIAGLGWVANPDLGEREAVGGRDGTVRKSVGESLDSPTLPILPNF